MLIFNGGVQATFKDMANTGLIFNPKTNTYTTQVLESVKDLQREYINPHTLELRPGKTADGFTEALSNIRKESAANNSKAMGNYTTKGLTMAGSALH